MSSLKPGAELSVQLLHRAYCYLRLCGLEPALALAGTRSALDVLVSDQRVSPLPDPLPRGEREHEVWARLQELTARPIERAPDAPPILRGHMVYP